MNRDYTIAWKMAIHCLKNGIPKEIWISPIPDKHKDALWNKAKQWLIKKGELNG